MPMLQGLKGLKSAQSGHAHIQQHHVCWGVVRRPEKLLPALGLAHHVYVGQVGEHPAQPLADDAVVISDHDSH